MDELPPFARAERDDLVEEIREAFAGVTREDGVSWSESHEIDSYVPDEAVWQANRAVARALDTDTSWEQLIEDPEWNGDAETSSWSFLDDIGFRYYLPAVMVRCLRKGWSGDPIILTLTLDEGSLRGHQLDKWSPLDVRQRRCVKRFIEYMIVITGETYCEGDLWDWRRAYASYWRDVPNTNDPTAPQP